MAWVAIYLAMSKMSPQSTPSMPGRHQQSVRLSHSFKQNIMLPQVKNFAPYNGCTPRCWPGEAPEMGALSTKGKQRRQEARRSTDDNKTNLAREKHQRWGHRRLRGSRGRKLGEAPTTPRPTFEGRSTGKVGVATPGKITSQLLHLPAYISLTG